MSEPTAANYPASYEDNTSLLGPLEERDVALVKYAIAVNALQVTVEEELDHLVGPIVLQFEGGELWWVESGDITVTGGDTIFSLDDINQRGFHNSPIQPHPAYEEVYITLVHTHQRMLKKAIMALQQNGFRMGTAAQRTAYESSAVAGEGWLETDTAKIYYCFSAGTFTWVNRDHGDLDGLADDDHSQYHNDSRASTWHSGLSGAHIPNGDDHDHYSANEGAAVYRVRSGIHASRPAPGFAGDMYFSTDNPSGSGTLYISPDGSTWQEVSGAPTDAIAAFGGACPTGWTRYTNLDGKYMYVDNDNPGQSSGANSHNHPLTAHVQHYHTVASYGATDCTNPGTHAHMVGVKVSNDSQSRLAKTSNKGNSSTSSQSGAHNHTCSVPGTTTQTQGTPSPTTDNSTTQAPYQEVVWCKKD